jgi:hypothetical protein
MLEALLVTKPDENSSGLQAGLGVRPAAQAAQRAQGRQSFGPLRQTVCAAPALHEAMKVALSV